MSQYFARLAQRSGVSEVTAPVARSAADTAGGSWSKAAVETVTLGAPSSASAWLPDAEDFARPASLNPTADVAIVATDSPSSVAAAPEAYGDRPAVELATAPPATDGASFLAHVRAVGEQWRNLDATDAPHRPPLDSPVVAVPAVATIAAESSRESTAPQNAVPVADDHHDAHRATTPGRATASIRTAALPPRTATLPPPATDESTSAAPMSRHVDALPPLRGAIAGDRVNAQSPAAPAIPEQRPSPTASPSVQVHIGRIELEVHSPAAAASAPAPAVASAPPPAPVRAATFSAHRHYLRGR